MFSYRTYYKRKVTAKEIDYEVALPWANEGQSKWNCVTILPKEMFWLKTELAEECEECFLQCIQT